ncbi:hypothetical protein I8H84_03205 [Candidatus Saccharibacteria bacterium]|nr:hypothetical protein [Candidatus Saccharibacteria bacterium]MBH1972954.1 hypothetical protein [Candidatus Saccharibacteria bacterium]MBH1991156.1 hypothetical protein [Candidatus Saccharibacteria bacterium]
MNPENQILADLATKLTESAVRNTAGAVIDKVAAVKAKRDDKQTIRELDDIINSLLDDKGELVRIAQAYEQELVSQKISDSDIEYITNTLVPLIEQFVNNIGDETERAKSQALLSSVKSVISKEMITIMQLVGFNFKQAIGQPLTVLVRKTIESNMPTDDAELKRLNMVNSNLSIELSKDEESFQRFMRLTGRG